MHRLGIEDSIVVMRGQTIRSGAAMRELTHDCWNLDEIDARYAAFVRRFRPLLKASSGKSQIADRSAFLIRTLLIQEYRKVLLRDPWLPAELLPVGWHGAAAYQLCRNLYRVVHMRADAWLDEHMETADGPLPPVSRAFMRRFGGLEND
jgi:phenylacetic acid degradation operon negative regulatory protein